MATIDDVYAKLLELEAKMTKLQASQKDAEAALSKKIALMGTEVSRLRTLIK